MAKPPNISRLVMVQASQVIAVMKLGVHNVRSCIYLWSMLSWDEENREVSAERIIGMD